MTDQSYLYSLSQIELWLAWTEKHLDGLSHCPSAIPRKTMCSVHRDVPYSPGYLLFQFFNTLGHLVPSKIFGARGRNTIFQY